MVVAKVVVVVFHDGVVVITALCGRNDCASWSES